jgi:hypothetical protein
MGFRLRLYLMVKTMVSCRFSLKAIHQDIGFMWRRTRSKAWLLLVQGPSYAGAERKQWPARIFEAAST